jgi:hypothetical protein
MTETPVANDDEPKVWVKAQAPVLGMRDGDVRELPDTPFLRKVIEAGKLALLPPGETPLAGQLTVTDAAAQAEAEAAVTAADDQAAVTVTAADDQAAASAEPATDQASADQATDTADTDEPSSSAQRGRRRRSSAGDG